MAHVTSLLEDNTEYVYMLAAFTFAAALLHTSGTARVARCCPPAAAVLPAIPRTTLLKLFPDTLV